MERGPRSKFTGVTPKITTSLTKSTIPTRACIIGKKLKNNESPKRPVKRVQIIREVEYSSSLQEKEDPPASTDNDAPDGEAKKKCILLIVKKNKYDNNNSSDTPNRNTVAPPSVSCKRPRMSVEPLPKPAGSGRYVKMRKDALQSLPELRDLINFHRSKHAELILENQLYDSSLGDKLSLPISPSVSLPPLKKTFQEVPRRDTVRTYRKPPPTLPEGPGYLFALNTQEYKPSELWLGPTTPSTHHVPSSPFIREVKENIPMSKHRDVLKGILYRDESTLTAHPRLPVVEILSPSLLEYENVTILDDDPLKDLPKDSKADSRANKVLEDFDFLNSWEPLYDPEESGYIPNCPDFDFKSLEIDKALIETAPEEPPEDPLLEQLCRAAWQETFDPFQQPVHPSPTQSVRGRKVSELTSKPEKFPLCGIVASRWKCKLCGEKHATKNSLITHLKLHQQPFCPICLFVASSSKKLRTHTLKAHPANARQELWSVDGVIVTSKYGRRRAVLDAATLCGRKRLKPRNSI